MKKEPSPALLALQAAFPHAFPADDAALRPLAIGIREALQDWAQTQPDLHAPALRDALARHCHRPAYRRILLAGTPRINLHGEPVGAVTAGEAEQARRDLAARQVDAEQRARELAAKAARHAAAEAKRKENPDAFRKPKVAKPPKAKAKPAPAPVNAAPVAVKPKPAAPVVVVKKRRSVATGGGAI